MDRIKDAVKFSFSDWRTSALIGVLLFLISITNKSGDRTNLFEWVVFIVFWSIYLLIIGYGSYLSAYTLQGRDQPPKFNNYQKLFFEGLKKFAIIFIYFMVTRLLFTRVIMKVVKDPVHFLFISLFSFILLNVLLIGGLINRYNYHGTFFRAFNFPEIIGMLKDFPVKLFVQVMIFAFIAQAFMASCIIDFSKGLSTFEIIYSLLFIVFAPLIYLSIKRLLGLYVGDLLADS